MSHVLEQSASNPVANIFQLVDATNTMIHARMQEIKYHVDQLNANLQGELFMARSYRDDTIEKLTSELDRVKAETAEKDNKIEELTRLLEGSQAELVKQKSTSKQKDDDNKIEELTRLLEESQAELAKQKSTSEQKDNDNKIEKLTRLLEESQAKLVKQKSTSEQKDNDNKIEELTRLLEESQAELVKQKIKSEQKDDEITNLKNQLASEHSNTEPAAATIEADDVITKAKFQVESIKTDLNHPNSDSDDSFVSASADGPAACPHISGTITSMASIDAVPHHNPVLSVITIPEFARSCDQSSVLTASTSSGAPSALTPTTTESLSLANNEKTPTSSNVAPSVIPRQFSTRVKGKMVFVALPLKLRFRLAPTPKLSAA